ncbi:MAG: amidohydrolase [Bacteroidales bacterium]|nr:amidohydrolase [Bacteroidales bacterium]MCF8454760.1 amidohydrolase [Bacteroidales bacterium]
MKRLSLISLLAIFALFNSCSPIMKKADLILINAKVYTVDSAFTMCEALAVKDGKIIKTGSTEDIQKEFTSEKIIDAGGKVVYPGFYDAHCHFYGYGTNVQSRADLRGTKSFDEVIERVVAHNQKYLPEWLQGRGWDQNDWPEKEFPDKEKLDELFPNKPVLLLRIDGHAALANSKALELAGLDITSQIEGGEYVQKDGQLTGLLIDNGIDIVRELIPEASKEEIAEALLISQDSCLKHGLTSVGDAGIDKNVVVTIEELQNQGKLKMRVYAMLSPNEENIDHFVKNGVYVTDKLSVRSIKLYADGALGSRGAKMIEPYSDDPGNTGLLLHEPAYYDSLCQLAYENGYQANIHAIGDAGVRMSLELYGKFLKGENDLRWRIEHAQVVHPDDFQLFKRYSIVPSVQATHATSDMYWAGDRLGEERVKFAYAYKLLLDQNGWLPNGTDFPIEKINPLLTYYAAVFRKDLNNWPDGGFQPENALSPEEALRSITIWPAKAAFEEQVKGSIETGKFADFVIFEKDFLTTNAKNISLKAPTSVYIAGEKVFGKDSVVIR